MPNKIVFLYGGASEEHEISLRSAVHVLRCLSRLNRQVDVIGVGRDGKLYQQDYSKSLNFCLAAGSQDALSIDHSRPTTLEKYLVNSEPVTLFPMIHGRTGEDGRIQGLAEFYQWPLVSSSCRASAIGMDKEVAKLLAQHNGIDIVPFITITKKEWSKNPEKTLQEIKNKFGSTCFLKPARSGSAVGTHLIRNLDSFPEAIKDSFKYGDKVLVEKAITERRELEVAVIGDSLSGLRLSDIGEIINEKHEFYDYEAKYSASSLATTAIPAALDANLRAQILDYAERIYLSFELSVYCRIDFFFDKKDKKLYFNEINSIPGMTSISLFPKLFAHSGLENETLIRAMIEYAENPPEKIQL
jgi:D-alanine-D-alanine ligase